MNPIITIDETGLLAIAKTEEESAAGEFTTIQHESLHQAQQDVEACWSVKNWIKTTTSDGAEWHPEFATQEAAR